MQRVNTSPRFPKLCSQNNTSNACDVNKSTSVAAAAAAAGSKNHNYGIISLEKFKELTAAHFELPHLSHVSSVPQLIRQSPLLHPSSNESKPKRSSCTGYEPNRRLELAWPVGQFLLQLQRREWLYERSSFFGTFQHIFCFHASTGCLLLHPPTMKNKGNSDLPPHRCPGFG